jgi:hypothetical protein
LKRARLEKQPRSAPPYDVPLDQLGREQYQVKHSTPSSAIPGDPFNNPVPPSA